MDKTFKKAIAVGIAAVMTMSAASLSAFAAESYPASTGSAAGDIAILDDDTYTVAGQDTKQSKASEYREIDVLTPDTTVDGVTGSSGSVTSHVDVYATIPEGSDVNTANDGKVKVQVPTVIILSGTKSEGAYTGVGTVKAKGNIAGTSYIDVIPGFKNGEYDANGGLLHQTGKTDAHFSIAQPKQRFANTDSTSVTKDADNGTDKLALTLAPTTYAATTTTTITSTDATAGIWHGEFNYTITLGSVNS